MPELPEVETIRLQLDRILPGFTIKDIETRNQKSFQGDRKKIIGKKITNLRRFGKLLVIDLEDNLSLGVHLKMTGVLVYRGKKEPAKLTVSEDLTKLPSKHTRVIITFTNNDLLYFNDLRKFGWMRIIDNKQLDSFIKKLGIEPFNKDFTLSNFNKVLKKSSRAVKLVLMDQSKISGLGNIYANDALFCAYIHPQTKSNKLSDQEITKLFNCINKILASGIKYQGASDVSFRDAFGQKGKQQEHFLVYGRKGEKCLNNCQEKIKKIMLGGRGTYYCPSCQREKR